MVLVNEQDDIKICDETKYFIHDSLILMLTVTKIRIDVLCMNISEESIVVTYSIGNTAECHD